MVGRAPPREGPTRGRRSAPARRVCMIERTHDAEYPAHANHRNAVEAWASRQRFSGSSEPLVTELLRTYSYTISTLSIIYGKYGAYPVAAAAALQLGRKGNGGGEEEEHVQGVQRYQEEGVAGPADVEGRREEVDEREHGEGRDEHGVVDYRGVAGVGFGDHVSDQGHDQERPDELFT